MNWEKFKDHFDESWHIKMRPLIESEAVDKIYAHLRKRKKEGATIVPNTGDIYRAFRETPLDKMKCVILGMCPYHTKGVADGLALSCSITNALQPSLSQFYDGIEAEQPGGFDLGYTRTPDLTYLAQEGVLLLNAALTTEAGIAGAHQNTWFYFTRHVLQMIIEDTGVPIISLGKPAQETLEGSDVRNPKFYLEHPSYAARQNRKWETKGAFTEVNKILMDSNGIRIDWLLHLPF